MIVKSELNSKMVRRLGIDFSHDGGHLLSSLLGFKGDPHLNIVLVCVDFIRGRIIGDNVAKGVRNMKHNMMATANASAVVVAVIYAVCQLAFLVAPDLSLAVAQSWFHGISIGKFGAPEVTTGSFVLGLVSAAGGAWLVGYFFAWVYNKIAK